MTKGSYIYTNMVVSVFCVCVQRPIQTVTGIVAQGRVDKGVYACVTK